MKGLKITFEPWALFGATAVGVGAIVGGGIFVLAGSAFANTGPSALIAFAINGLVAFLTAMSFAEISSAFPESGGAYTFAKKILSVRSAFATGWVLWFAYIVAGVLYALGFASFAAVAMGEVARLLDIGVPSWLYGRRFALLLAVLSTLAYAVGMVRKSSGGGNLATPGKVIVFGVLIVAAAVAFLGQPFSESREALSPFFTGGTSGLFMAMGVTFIALQGFDLVAAVAGEVKDPGRVIPRAMFYSLGCALVIYLPLLVLISSVGVEAGQNISDLASANPETVIAVAAERFLGKVGFWLVMVAAVLSTLSALQANLFAASRVALSMARDSTLPAVLGEIHATRKTPLMAIATSALTLVAILFMVPNLEGAGAAASLIFLISFALAHATTYLARLRGGTEDAPYRTPWFPLIPIAGGLACVGLGVFQALMVPDAAGILLIWLALGVILYWSLFSRRAELADATAVALDPRLVRLRGHSPLVLVPIANPQRTPALVSVAIALTARNVGRILLLSIVPTADNEETESDDIAVPAQLKDTQTIIYDAIAECYASGHRPEALITSSSRPLHEIRRIADEHRCESLLLGMGDFSQEALSELELLLNDVDCDVAVIKTPKEWHASTAKRILVPVGGKGAAQELRMRLLGSLGRSMPRSLTFVTVLRPEATAAEVSEARRYASEVSNLRIPGDINIEVIRADDAARALIDLSQTFDLMIIGLHSGNWGRKALGPFTTKLAQNAHCATLLLSRRPARAYEFLDPLRNDVIDSIADVARRTNRVFPTRRPIDEGQELPAQAEGATKTPSADGGAAVDGKDLAGHETGSR